MDLKKRIERLEQATLSENQEKLVSDYLNALEQYILEADDENEPSEETTERLIKTASHFKFGKQLE